jgi:DNA-binding winged helix-turn-helix (wHTH) protein/tetratricopeptide (TPR) repeat protein
MTEATEYFFDGWTLKPATGELVRGSETIRLTQQPLRILIALLERPGEVVTRERLVELLWPKGVVDYDNGLNVAVRKLRMALGDDTGTPRYIETLPRIGYRFIGSMTAPTAPAPLAPAPAPSPAPVEATVPAKPPWISRGPLLMALILVLVGVFAWVQWPARNPQAPSSAPPTATAAIPRRTTNERAYEHYLKGIYNRSRRDRNSLQLALEHFEAAIREDPQYAEAWAGLADALVGGTIGHSIRAREGFERAREAAVRSVELDPNIAETRTALGQIYMFFDRDYAAAEAEYDQALAVNPNYARLWHHIGSLRAFQGRAVEALAAMRRARELEPMTLLYNANYGHVLYHSRRYDEAIAHLRPLLEATPTLDQARSVLIRSLVANGSVEQAAEHLGLRQSELPNISDAGLVYAKSGQRDNALLEIARIRKLSEQGYGVGYELAVIYAALGDVPQGCEALELAWKDASPFLGWMTLDPRMDPLRPAPCYAEIQRRLLG